VKKSPSALLAFLVATTVPPVFGFFTSDIFSGNLLEQLIGSFIVFYPFTTAAIIFIAVPTYLVLSRFQLVNFWTTTCTGLMGGAIVAVAFRSGDVQVKDFVVMCSLGLITALVFWFIYSKFTFPHNKRMQSDAATPRR